MSIYTLNEIDAMIYNIQQLIQDGAEQEQIQALLDAKGMLEMERGAKLEGYAMVIKNLESDVNGIDSEIKRLTERKKFMQNNISNMKERMAETLQAVEGNRLKTDKFTFSFRKSTSVSIEDETLIPPQFIKTETRISKSELTKALKNGEEIHGASLVENQSLSIR